MKYTFSMPRTYLRKIQRLKEILGLDNSSEVVRRAIDELASKYGVDIVEEVESDAS